MLEKCSIISYDIFQGEKVSYKDVEASLKKLSIQIDNLCQFLPQDRVVEFAKVSTNSLYLTHSSTTFESTMYETIIKTYFIV